MHNMVTYGKVVYILPQICGQSSIASSGVERCFNKGGLHLAVPYNNHRGGSRILAGGPQAVCEVHTLRVSKRSAMNDTCLQDFWGIS